MENWHQYGPCPPFQVPRWIPFLEKLLDLGILVPKMYLGLGVLGGMTFFGGGGVLRDGKIQHVDIIPILKCFWKCLIAYSYFQVIL